MAKGGSCLVILTFGATLCRILNAYERGSFIHTIVSRVSTMAFDHIDSFHAHFKPQPNYTAGGLQRGRGAEPLEDGYLLRQLSKTTINPGAVRMSGSTSFYVTAIV